MRRPATDLSAVTEIQFKKHRNQSDIDTNYYLTNLSSE